MKQLLTVRLRLRSKHRPWLDHQARTVNFVWNYCNETQRKAVESHRKWLHWMTLTKLTAGSSKLLDLNAQTIQSICKTFYDSRTTHKRPWLRWRSKRSLGWVPFSAQAIRFDGREFTFSGKKFRPMHYRENLLTGATVLKAGSFSQDALGRWFINVTVEREVTPEKVERECSANDNDDHSVGIDLGLKEFATLSTGEKITAPRFYRSTETKLATAQRAKKSKRVKRIHLKAKNRRKDFLHQASSRLTKRFGLIFVGNVSPSKLARTSFAKSVLDAGWSTFKNFLTYKSIANGGRTVEVNERMSTQTCSCCGYSTTAKRPKGIAGLGIREWTCDGCEAVLDRDVNAARNILRVGLDSLAEGALALRAA